MPRSRIAALTSLYLLAVCAVGMLHPVRNALVLGALGGQAFYKVYLASAPLALAVALFGHVAARVPQQRLTPAVALVFAVNLVVFRALFPGGVVYGVLFYAWHDLFAGILISQYFLATNALLDPRSAKRAYPWIVAAGSVGAAIGGAITGLVAPRIGVANLLLVAAGLTFAFAVAMPVVAGRAPTSELQPHVRLVADTSRAPMRAKDSPCRAGSKYCISRMSGPREALEGGSHAEQAGNGRTDDQDHRDVEERLEARAPKGWEATGAPRTGACSSAWSQRGGRASRTSCRPGPRASSADRPGTGRCRE